MSPSAPADQSLSKSPGKQKGQFLAYYRLLVYLALASKANPLDVVTRQTRVDGWVGNAQTLAAKLGRDLEADRSHFITIEADMIQIGIKPDEISTIAECQLPWQRPAPGRAAGRRPYGVADRNHSEPMLLGSGPGSVG